MLPSYHTSAMLLVLLICSMPLAASTPEVQLGKTRFIGRELAGLDEDFFGGMLGRFRCLMCSFKSKTLGIPFAEPPVGLLRLQPPILKTEINADVFNAQSFGHVCLQPVGGRLSFLDPSNDYHIESVF